MALALVMTLVSRKSPDPCRVKHMYCGLDIVELCVYDALANYNYDRKATLDIFVHMNMISRFYTSKLCHTLNFRRKYNAALHSKPTTKVRRKLIRGEKKKIDNQTSKEGITYEAGGY